MFKFKPHSRVPPTPLLLPFYNSPPKLPTHTQFPGKMPPLAAAHDLRLKSGRKPLQPKNSPAHPLPKIKQRIEISLLSETNKENHHPIFTKSAASPIESCDSSLAEELNAIKKKLERLRSDADRTGKMLRERDVVLELQMKEILQRGQVQRDLEIEVDRLFRLNELRSYCMRISPIRTLREKEREKIITGAQFPESEVGDGEESVGENSS